MRLDNCTKCARKHLRQAMITYMETKKGHPEKWDTCLGHLAEAADALIVEHNPIALALRDVYLSLDEDRGYLVKWDDLFLLLEGL